jgi:hypothetical protein
MAVNPWTEELLTLEEAKRVIPRRRGRRPSVPTLWRWCRKGIRGISLEYIRVGRNIVTSKEALSRFFQGLAQSDAPLSEPPFAPTRQPKPLGTSRAAREASLREADRILDEAGI